jgi:hypothetical protein
MGFGDKQQSSGPTLTFGLNVTLDGCVDHQERIADDETHAFFTRLMDEGGAILWRRVTCGMVQTYWEAVARGEAEAPPTVREWAAKLEVKPKPVVSSTRTDFPWSRPLCIGVDYASPSIATLGSSQIRASGRSRDVVRWLTMLSLGGAYRS